jgi:hypothetical protein
MPIPVQSDHRLLGRGGPAGSRVGT